MHIFYQFASNTPIQAIDLDGLEALRRTDFTGTCGTTCTRLEILSYKKVLESKTGLKVYHFTIDKNNNQTLEETRNTMTPLEQKLFKNTRMSREEYNISKKRDPDSDVDLGKIENNGDYWTNQIATTGASPLVNGTVDNSVNNGQLTQTAKESIEQFTDAALTPVGQPCVTPINTVTITPPNFDTNGTPLTAEQQNLIGQQVQQQIQQNFQNGKQINASKINYQVTPNGSSTTKLDITATNN